MSEKYNFNLKLERYLLGELPAAEMAKMDAELAKNADLRKQLEALKLENEKYYQKYPRLNVPQERRRAARKSWFSVLFSPVYAGGFALAAASICVVLLLPPNTTEKNSFQTQGDPDSNGSTPETNSGDNGVRVKGLKPALFLSVMRDAKAQEFKDGDLVHAGDEVMIAYRASAYKYGLILSVDAEKSVTLHFPEANSTSQQLQAGKKVSLKLAFKLDEKPGFEKFYFIASERVLPLRQIMQEMAKTGGIKNQLPKDANLAAINLKKE